MKAMKPLSRILSALRDHLSPKNRPERCVLVQVSNLTRNTTLATSMETAHTGKTRRKGLLGRQDLHPGQGLWIRPCESVHTFGMQFAIDLIYLDRNHRVKKVRSNVRPWRLSACLTAHSVLELPQGTIRHSLTKPGDCLELSEKTPITDLFDNAVADAGELATTS